MLIPNRWYVLCSSGAPWADTPVASEEDGIRVKGTMDTEAIGAIVPCTHVIVETDENGRVKPCYSSFGSLFSGQSPSAS